MNQIVINVLHTSDMCTKMKKGLELINEHKPQTMGKSDLILQHIPYLKKKM